MFRLAADVSAEAALTQVETRAGQALKFRFCNSSLQILNYAIAFRI